MSHNTESNELRTQILEEMEARRIDHKTYVDAEWLLDQYDTLKDTEKEEAVREERERIFKELRKYGITAPSMQSLVLNAPQFEAAVTPLPESDKTEI